MLDRGSLSIKIFMILFIVALYFVFLSIFLVAVAKADEKVRLAYISDSPGSSAPYWIARETGLFKKYGLDGELIFINGSTRGIQSLIAGDLDFVGAVGTSAINGRLAGGDIAIIDSLVNTLPYYIIGNPTIRSPEDLKGRAAAAHIPGTSADFALRLALRKYGIDYPQIKAVMVGGATARVAAVINGQVDFTMVTDSGKIQGEKAGLRVIIDMAKLKIPFQFTCTVTTKAIIRTRPPTVENMVKSLAEAVHFFKSNKEESIKIMAKYTRGAKPDVLEGSWVAYKDLLEEDTYPTLEGLNDTLAVQANWDPKAATAKAEDLVDLRFVKQLKTSGFIDKLYGRSHVSRN
ncbi:MAG TPA: ABC transporter substrate-binding protein [Methylomirabilota bacterium]|nr:ABC transporter substrate-binding protein [Methylomirabilota bacterium]